jgi:carboxyl-terminal processing protease
MSRRTNKAEFFALLTFLLVMGLVLTNGFAGRIFAQQEDVYRELEPIGDVLDKILREYVRSPDIEEVVEGALMGMMRALDPHSAYIPPQAFEAITEDTEGEFQGIGIRIHLDDAGNLQVYEPIPAAPASVAGVTAGDYILKIDGVSTEGLSLAEAAKLIKGPRGTFVTLTLFRHYEEAGVENEELEIQVKRDRIPVESIVEGRMLKGGIGYLRVSDFKKNTADEIEQKLDEFMKQGMKSLVLDLRWNPGGLLSSATEVSDVFLPRNKLITFTRGRDNGRGASRESMHFFTRKPAAIPADVPMVVLINGSSASSSEIVTGALQFHKRALVVGEKTFGKGSVQTIIPLARPQGSALRLTTALHYTPAEVTIDGAGIRPDVEAVMSKKEQVDLLRQLYKSYEKNPALRHEQNHGTITGNSQIGEDELIEDIVLQRAVEILREDSVFENLLKKYHKDTSETQVAKIKEDGSAATPAVSEQHTSKRAEEEAPIAQ